jgi:asparaginyl-tRNA synthetase
MTYREAVDALKEDGSGIEFGQDLGGEDETLLSARFERPVIVTHYPAEIKPFYMKRDPEDPDLALCLDMLAPEGYGEIIGGSVREDDYETLARRIEEHQLPRESFEWYLDLRRYGSVPHAGFGMGIERVVAWIAGVRHVPETIPFPRLIHRIYP